jgi:hypothetical protein
MKKMLKSSVVLMLAVVVGLMLSVGCEDSELSRLLGLSKKKNDFSAQQPQENNNNPVVENVGGIQPMDITVPSGKNYIKVLQISGNRSPNDLGYAGTWEYFDPTPVGTERMRYDTKKPQDVDEVGEWSFFDPVPVGTEVTRYDITRPEDAGEIGTWQFVDCEIPYKDVTSAYKIYADRVEDVSLLSIFINKNFMSFRGKITLPNMSATNSDRSLFVSNGTSLFNGISLVHWENSYYELVPANGVTDTTNALTLQVSTNRLYLLNTPKAVGGIYDINFDVPIKVTTAQPDAKNIWRKTALGSTVLGRVNVWQKTVPSTSPVPNRVNNWGRTK